MLLSRYGWCRWVVWHLHLFAQENIRLKFQVDSQSDQHAAIKIRPLVQYVEYYIDKGVLGENKHLSYTVLEHRSPRVPPFSQRKYDSHTDQPIRLPVVPPTTIGVCRLIQIYYVLKVSLELDKSGEDLTMEFPFTVATVPFRIPNSQTQPKIEYEGGMYISPEFQIGQVYDGTAADDENVLLYRPVYVRIAKESIEDPPVPSVVTIPIPTEPPTSATSGSNRAPRKGTLNGTPAKRKLSATNDVDTRDVTVALIQTHKADVSQHADVSNNHADTLVQVHTQRLSKTLANDEPAC